jgi:hypothetical protein
VLNIGTIATMGTTTIGTTTTNMLTIVIIGLTMATLRGTTAAVMVDRTTAAGMVTAGRA